MSARPACSPGKNTVGRPRFPLATWILLTSASLVRALKRDGWWVEEDRSGATLGFIKHDPSQPACLTTRRGEVRERAVRTRREPGGGKGRAQMELTGTFSSRATPSPTNRFFTRHETRPFRMPPWSHSRAATRGFGSRNTKHETRNTAFSTRNTAFYHVLRPSDGEKCRPSGFSLLCAVLLGYNQRQAASRLTCADGVDRHVFESGNPKPHQPVFHETRDTAFPHAALEPQPRRHPGFWVTKHETRDTKHGF